MAYLLTKTAHLVFVIAWMATVFYLPRILVNIAEAGPEPAVRARLLLMWRRLYGFGHTMFGIATVLGAILAVIPVLLGGSVTGMYTAAQYSWFIGCGVGFAVYYLLGTRDKLVAASLS